MEPIPISAVVFRRLKIGRETLSLSDVGDLVAEIISPSGARSLGRFNSLSSGMPALYKRQRNSNHSSVTHLSLKPFMWKHRSTAIQIKA